MHTELVKFSTTTLIQREHYNIIGPLKPDNKEDLQRNLQNIIKMRRGFRGSNEKTHSIKDNLNDIDEDNNTDLGFLKTLLPHMSKIEESEKLVFQQAIQQVVLDFAYPIRNQDFTKTYEALSEAQCKKFICSKKKKGNHDTSSDDDDCVVIKTNIKSRPKETFNKLLIKKEIKTEPIDVKPAIHTNMKPYTPINYVPYLPNYYAAPDGQPQYFGNEVTSCSQVLIQYQQSQYSQLLVPSTNDQQIQSQYVQQQAPTQLQQQILDDQARNACPHLYEYY